MVVVPNGPEIVERCAPSVREITSVARPLSGLATFLTGIGPRFARGRRGRATAMVMRLTARPLPAMFTMLDPVMRWLVRPTRQAGNRSA